MEDWAGRMKGVCLYLVQEFLQRRLAGGEKFAGQNWLAAHNRLVQRYCRPDAEKNPGQV